MWSPRAYHRIFESKNFQTCAPLPQSSRPWTQQFAVLPLLVCGIASVSPNAFGQAADASHWANVSGWKGTVTVSGKGSGTIKPDCAGGTNDYTNTQSVNASPELLRSKSRCRLRSGHRSWSDRDVSAQKTGVYRIKIRVQQGILWCC
jgi:hypothetical protein